MMRHEHGTCWFATWPHDCVDYCHRIPLQEAWLAEHEVRQKAKLQGVYAHIRYREGAAAVPASATEGDDDSTSKSPESSEGASKIEGADSAAVVKDLSNILPKDGPGSDKRSSADPPQRRRPVKRYNEFGEPEVRLHDWCYIVCIPRPSMQL